MRGVDNRPQSGDALARVVGVLFEDFAEVQQLAPTFGRRGEAGLSVFSRLDRVYSNLAQAEASSRYWFVAVVGPRRMTSAGPVAIVR